MTQKRNHCTGMTGRHARFMNMLEILRDNAGELPEQVQSQVIEILAQAPEALNMSPRENNDPCISLRKFILHFMLIDLEERYGDMQFPETTYRIPFYEHHRETAGVRNSQVISFNPTHPLAREYDFGVCIGWSFDCWEAFFYQMAHEAVHLLNPKVAPSGMLKTSALDEGVAVRYAEEMLATYLPGVDRYSVGSPAGLPNAYNAAWQATRKLPDKVLRQIRDTFGGFGDITDPVRFEEMTAQWLTPAEAGLLSSDFRYR
ncbi:hypothetical protein C2478_20220 [Salmonella enterica]|nr:hypothetical protein [Salmonella enterica]ECC4608412.1 hypothetical protein [Salmonella enterica]ECR4999219.1 hypothetical protein [Salmonella enterica]EGH8741810.1 hypothetical protein [Salmonella enterica]EGO9987186.1 hypothetical protein [Salmonella enterica]